MQILRAKRNQLVHERSVAGLNEAPLQSYASAAPIVPPTPSTESVAPSESVQGETESEPVDLTGDSPMTESVAGDAMEE